MTSLHGLVEDLRQMLEETGRIFIHADDNGGRLAGFRYSPPGADGQTYGSYLVGDDNGKTVQKFAAAALQVLLKQRNYEKLSSSEVTDFVDDYVMKNAGKRARKVRWNLKWYPD